MKPFPASLRTAAAAMHCLLALRLTLESARECISGSAWTGRSFTRMARCPCRFVATSALVLHSSSACSIEIEKIEIERRKHEYETTFRVAHTGGCARFVRAGSDSARRYARGRHDLKFLSIRGEATPRTPVWR